MEKLAYVLWKRAGETDRTFAERLLAETAPELLASGARFLKISVVDDEVAPGAALRIGQMDPPKAGLATFWLDQAQERGPLEKLLGETCDRLAGYLVVESRPLVPVNEFSRPGERTPGFHLVSCITRKSGMGHGAFIEYWHQRFRDVAIETQSTFDYIRNEIIRPLTEGAPAWDALVEEGFPTGALTDPHVFYDSLGNDLELQARQARMFEHVQQFLDLGKIEVHPMSEYAFERRLTC
ncbi:MAG: hypothetical protein GY723_03095 [bacterium]|nr:hypothetical protein [bacterium]MCP5070994.1 hypothetical protein [bacterium]